MFGSYVRNLVFSDMPVVNVVVNFDGVYIRFYQYFWRVVTWMTVGAEYSATVG